VFGPEALSHGDPDDDADSSADGVDDAGFSDEEGMPSVGPPVADAGTEVGRPGKGVPVIGVPDILTLHVLRLDVVGEPEMLSPPTLEVADVVDVTLPVAVTLVDVRVIADAVTDVLVEEERNGEGGLDTVAVADDTTVARADASMADGVPVGPGDPTSD
jgi:hypothetical protein